MDLTQDQAKIVIQILDTLMYKPQEGKIISEIIDKLQKSVIDKELKIPLVSVSPENMNIKIERKAK